MSNTIPTSFEWDVKANTIVFQTVIRGSEGIKKPEKIFNKYQIPQGETILAYSKSSGIIRLGLSLSGIIITDQAFYIHPAKESGTEENRIPFSVLCNYLPVQEDEKSPVYLISQNREIFVLGGTIIAKNPVGQEIKAFLLGMEKHLIRTYTWAAEQRKTIASWAIETAKKMLSRTRLDEKTKGILDAIKDDLNVCHEVAEIIAADLYRSGRFDEFHKYIGSLSALISYEERAKLLSGNEILNQYLSELKDISHDVDKGLLEEFCKNMEEKEYTDLRFVAYGYAAVRLFYDSEELDILFDAVQKAFPGCYNELRIFHAKYNNHRMASVFSAIRNGDAVEREVLRCSDSLGFTPLTYAMILKKEEQLKSILKKGKWRETYPSGISEETAGIFNYTVLAFLCNYDKNQAIFILKNTSEILRSMERHLKVLKGKRWLYSQLISAQKNKIRNIQSRAASGEVDPYDEIEDSLCRLRTAVEKNQVQLDHVDDEISEVEKEIEKYIVETLNQSYSVARYLRSSDNPLVKLYLRLIDTPVLLYDVLHNSQTRPLLFCWNTFYFVAQEALTQDVYGWREGNVYYIGRKAASQVPPPQDESSASSYGDSGPQAQKPYGTSWFSPAAHSDPDALRKEYRQLAKQYHPDANNLKDTTKIFQEILNEKIEILEKMK